METRGGKFFGSRGRVFLAALLVAITSAILLLQIVTVSPSDKQARAVGTEGAIEQLVDRWFHSQQLSGASLISRRGRIVLEKYYGSSDARSRKAVTEKTRFHIGSLSKQFTGFIILSLELEGKLSQSDRVSDVFPSTVGKPVGAVTVRHLLEMTSGLPEIIHLPKYLSVQLSSSVRTSEEFIDEISSYSLAFSPGSKFLYSNVGYTLLAAIAEKVTGVRWDQLLQRRVFGPFSMEHTSLQRASESAPELAVGSMLIPRFFLFGNNRLLPLPNWNYSMIWGAGGIVSTVTDFFRWDRGLAEKGVADPAWANRYYSGEGPTGYSYGWDVGSYRLEGHPSKTILRHSGETPGYCSLIIRVPDTDSAAIFLWNTDYTLLTSKKESEQRKAFQQELERYLSL